MIESGCDPFTAVFFNAESGALSVRLDRKDGTSLHMHSLVDPEREADYFADVRLWGDRIVLAGCGLGYHLMRLITTISDQTAVLLVEFYEEFARRTLERFPDSLRRRVTIVTSGSERPQDMVAAFCKGGRHVQVIRHPPSFKAHEEFYRQVLGGVTAFHAVSRPPRKILLMRGDFFAERELQQAANENGLKTTLFLYKLENSMVGYESNLQRLIQTEKPDLVISVNMLGFDGNGILAEYTFRCGIPVAVWFVDDPRPILLNQRRFIRSNMIAFSWERAYIPWLIQQGFGSVHYLPLATDPDLFSSKSTREPNIKCGFIGTSMGGSFLKGITEKFIWKQQYHKIVQEVVVRIMDKPLDDEIDRYVTEACFSKNIPLAENDEHTRTWLRSYIIHTASMIKRRSCISSLIPMGVEVFGDQETWQELCGKSLITHPEVDYYSDIADCYRSIIVNINITSCQMPSALNQRVFDAPACGAFILNDFQKDLDELFSEDEYVAYYSPQELPEKVQFYLRNEKMRNTVVTAARKRILNEHTYSHRLQTMIENL